MVTRIEQLFSISNKVVVLTGAAGILYGTIAEVLSVNGAKVALLDIAEDQVKQKAAKIHDAGGDAIGLYCDVLNEESIQKALDAILDKFGTCDTLINGAGGNKKGACVPPDGKFTELSTDEIDQVFALNYKGTILPSMVFSKYFAKKGKGNIINTSSMSAFSPLTNVAGYSNAKAAVTNFTRWLAVQVKVDFPDADIRVNEIAPGFFDTNQNHHLLFEEDDVTLTKRGKSIIINTPLGRFGDPNELVGPIILLISEAGSFLQGTTLCIDGGFSIYCGVGPLDEKK